MPARCVRQRKRESLERLCFLYPFHRNARYAFHESQWCRSDCSIDSPSIHSAERARKVISTRFFAIFARTCTGNIHEIGQSMACTDGNVEKNKQWISRSYNAGWLIWKLYLWFFRNIFYQKRKYSFLNCFNRYQKYIISKIIIFVQSLWFYFSYHKIYYNLSKNILNLFYKLTDWQERVEIVFSKASAVNFVCEFLMWRRRFRECRPSYLPRNIHEIIMLLRFCVF